MPDYYLKAQYIIGTINPKIQCLVPITAIHHYYAPTEVQIIFSKLKWAGVVLKHKNVSSIEEYNIGDRLKYSRIKQSSKKDIEESRINVKYQEHYRSIWNSAKCKVQCAKCKVQSAI